MTLWCISYDLHTFTLFNKVQVLNYDVECSVLVYIITFFQSNPNWTQPIYIYLAN